MTLEIAIVKQYLDLASLSPFDYWLLAGVSGAITIFVSAISYQYLEYPFLHLRTKHRGTAVRQTQVAETAA
jgi:peptidoglycan/LPS O-acetylase OafA/YrhL